MLPQTPRSQRSAFERRNDASSHENLEAVYVSLRLPRSNAGISPCLPRCIEGVHLKPYAPTILYARLRPLTNCFVKVVYSRNIRQQTQRMDFAHFVSWNDEIQGLVMLQVIEVKGVSPFVSNSECIPRRAGLISEHKGHACVRQILPEGARGFAGSPSTFPLVETMRKAEDEKEADRPDLSLSRIVLNSVRRRGTKWERSRSFPPRGPLAQLVRAHA